MKVFIIGGSHDYTMLFTLLGFIRVDKMEEANLICFTGGEDVSPNLYNHEKHSYTYNSQDRDNKESKLYIEAKKLGLPCVGICRGGQFLNVMSGGTMWQHVTNHGGDHTLFCEEFDGKYNGIVVSSTHHQMMIPGSKGDVLATAKKNSTGIKYNTNTNEFESKHIDEEVEIVFYEEARNLCFQPHPEFHEERYHDMRNLFSELVTALVNDTL